MAWFTVTGVFDKLLLSSVWLFFPFDRLLQAMVNHFLIMGGFREVSAVRKKVLKAILILVLSLVVLGLAFLLSMAYLGSGTVSYLVRADVLDTEVLGSFPQEIVSVDQTASRPVFEIVTSGGKDGFVPATVPARYSEELAKYLLPSAKIESDDPGIVSLAKEIAPGETDVVAIAREAARWTSKNVIYDAELADRIWNGEVATQSALETLDRGLGTCSEYANLFIAIMRARGIPARFVMGRMYFGSYHAWAEIWLGGQGWVPVETQSGKIGVSARHIKLFAGTDFVDIGVPLQVINMDIKRLGRVRR